jgi:hypothetical protein
MEVECLCKSEFTLAVGIAKVKSFSNSNGYFLANNSRYYQTFCELN